MAAAFKDLVKETLNCNLSMSLLIRPSLKNRLTHYSAVNSYILLCCGHNLCTDVATSAAIHNMLKHAQGQGQGLTPCQWHAPPLAVALQATASGSFLSETKFQMH